MAFAVKDQGVGIPKEEQRRVLERFESRTPGLRGTAAPASGSAIVESLVGERPRGTIALESEPSRGACHRAVSRTPTATADAPRLCPAPKLDFPAVDARSSTRRGRMQLADC